MEWGIYKTLLQQGHSSYFEPKHEEGAAWLKDVTSGAATITEEDFKKTSNQGLDSLRRCTNPQV